MSRKIQVLHVLNAMDLGGIESFIMNVFRRMDKSKIQFDFALNVQHKTYFHDEILDLGGRIFILPHPKEGILKYKTALTTILGEEGPYDVVHTHSYLFNGIPLEVAAKNNIPVRISHSHTVQDKKNSSLKRKIYRYVMKKKIDKNATHLLGCSELACETLYGKRKFNSDKRVGVIKNGIKLSSFQGNSSNFLRDELGLPIDVKIIGNVGRFAKVKNHDFLLRIFKKIIEEGKDNYHLVLVGQGEELDRIQKIVNSYGIEEKVSFLGNRKDIPEIMAGFDLFLFPSVYEGLGIVLIEAQASNISCLISDGIAKDAIVVPHLIEVGKLSDNIDIWAKKAIKILELRDKRRYPLELAIPPLEKSGYDIRDVTNLLENIYSSKKQ